MQIEEVHPRIRHLRIHSPSQQAVIYIAKVINNRVVIINHRRGYGTPELDLTELHIESVSHTPEEALKG